MIPFPLTPPPPVRSRWRVAVEAAAWVAGLALLGAWGYWGGSPWPLVLSAVAMGVAVWAARLWEVRR